MPTITVKNVPDELYERLKEAARAHRRSINREILVCIEQAVGPRRVEAEVRLAEARQLREQTAPYRLSDQEFSQVKAAGRP
jgi:plasmid stability protein